jgi:WS/DGAT/MGAT family acyltransferase
MSPRPKPSGADVRRLSGADTVLLLSERATCPQHTLKIAIVDPSGATGPVTFEAFRAQMRDAVTRLEPLRWQLVRAPGDLAHPAWIDTPVTELDRHLHHATLDAPGGPRELCTLVGTITEPLLARDRPLWEIWYVDGLAEGRIAYVAKVHHALADGVASGELLAMAFASDSPPVAPGAGSGTGETVPDRAARWWAVAREVAEMVRRFPRLLAHTVRVGLRGHRVRRRLGHTGQAKPFRGPHTRLDAPLTRRRAFAYETFDLATIKGIAHATGTTVTEVAVAAVGGALRAYFAARDELPAATLTGAIPVSVRDAAAPTTWGTHVATWYLPLGTDVADPLARLRTVSARAREARASLEATDPQLQHAWAEYWRLFCAFTLGLPRLVRWWSGRPSYNAIVSTVRASAEPLERDGARLVQLVSVGPLVEGIGLNVTAWSYAGAMTFALLACADHVDDIWDLAAALRASVDELAAASASSGPSSLSLGRSAGG